MAGHQPDAWRAVPDGRRRGAGAGHGGLHHPDRRAPGDALPRLSRHGEDLLGQRPREGGSWVGRAGTGGRLGAGYGHRGLSEAAAAFSRRAQRSAAEPGVSGRHRQRVFGRDPVRGPSAAPTTPSVTEAGRRGSALRGDPVGPLARRRGDPGQSQLRGVEAGSVLHVGAHERGQDVSAVRTSDQPAGLESRAAELLPGLPALNRQTCGGPSLLFWPPPPAQLT